MNPTAIAFLKAPTPGLVKTRIARQLGDLAATAIYRTLAEEKWHRIPSDWHAEVFFTPPAAEGGKRGWLGGRGIFRAQSKGDLGARLMAGFAAAFQRGGAPVIAINGDCPELDGACLEEARAALNDADVVLGPAVDGGYYLIGLSRPTPELFSDIPWRSPEARAAQLRCRMLGVKADIDNGNSWARCHARFSGLRHSTIPLACRA